MYDYFTKLQDYLKNTSKKIPNNIALICNSKKYNYKEIDDTSDQIAMNFVRLGIKKRDSIIICLENSYELILFFWAGLKAGAVISILSLETPNKKLKYILNDSKAKSLIITKEKYIKIRKYLEDEKNNLPMVITDEKGYFPDGLSFRDLMKNNSFIALPNILDIDLAAIIYTSGSTGEPKGVMLTHRNMLSATASINQYLEQKNNDHIISVLPMSFDYGLYQMILAFSVGACLILERNFFWPSQVLKKISDYRASILPVVPSMILIMYEHYKKFNYDLSSINIITNTGASLNSKHVEILKKMFKNSKIFSMYGLTECKRCSYLPPQMIEKKPNSIGIAIPNTELWIVDDNNNRLKANQIGELVIRGSTVMQGYLNKPELTNKKLKAGFFPSEMILYTGDLCWLDDEGYLYFYERRDEIIKSRGIKVVPREIESFLMSIEEVTEAAIIGVDDPIWGSAIFVFIICESSLTESMLFRHCKRKLSNHNQPKYISIIDSMPKNGNGKIDKNKLKMIAEKKVSDRVTLT